MMDEKDQIKHLGCRRTESDRRQAMRRAVDACRATVIEGIACDKTWAQIADDLKARHGITRAVTHADVTRLWHGDPADTGSAAATGAPLPPETLRRIVERASIATDAPDPAAPPDAVVTAGWAPAPRAIRRGKAGPAATSTAWQPAEPSPAGAEWDPWEDLAADLG